MNIIELAREAGLLPCHEIYQEDLHAFAAAVIAARDAELIAGVGEPAGIFYLDGEFYPTRDYTAEQVAGTVAKERKSNEEAWAVYDKRIDCDAERIATLESTLKEASEAMDECFADTFAGRKLVAKIKEVLHARK